MGYTDSLQAVVYTAYPHLMLPRPSLEEIFGVDDATDVGREDD